MTRLGKLLTLLLDWLARHSDLAGFTMARRKLFPTFLLICLALGWGLNQAGAAQASAPAERRMVVVEGVDYFGRDLETRQDIELDACQAACLANDRCQAFTYNRKARWCFLKSDYEDARPFPNAVSGHIAKAEADAQQRQSQRLAELGFLPRGYTEEARRQAAEIAVGPRPVSVRFDRLLTEAEEAEHSQNWQDALIRYGAALRLTPDSPAAWLGLSRASLAYDPGDWQARQRLLGSSSAAAINAYLRAATTPERLGALTALGQSLAARDQWRPAIRALRAALTIKEDESVRSLYEEWLTGHGFRITGHQVDADAASPRICIEFSDPLPKDRGGLDDFLQIEADRGLTVEVDPQALCVDGVVHGERYRLRVRAGLPATDGETLARSADLDIYVRDRSPSVRFQGRAYVLPKGGEAAMPLVSVNTRLVKAQVLRLGERALATAATAGPLLRALNQYESQEIRDRQGEVVWTGTVEVGMELNREITTAIPLGTLIQEMKPGAYVMTAQPDERSDPYDELATQWFVVSDLGLAGLTGADGLHALVRSLSSAQSMSGVSLRLIARNDEVLGRAVTDEQGHARFEPGLLRGEGGNKPALLVAEGPDGDFAFLDLSQSPFDLSDRGVAGRPAPGAVDVFLTTERGVYRAGETVQVTALARNSQALALTGTPLTFRLRRPDGVEHSRVQLADQGLGGRHLAIELPTTAMRGTWRVAVHTDPEAPPLAEQPFLVEDFQPERIAFEPDLEAATLDAAGDQEIKLEARFLFGAPAAGLEVEGEVRLEPTDSLAAHAGFHFGLADEEQQPVSGPLPLARTDALGQASLPLQLPPVPAGSRPYLAKVAVRVLETGGQPVERTLERPLADTQPRLGIKPLFAGAVDEGGTAAFEVIALDPRGQRLALQGVRWTLSRLTTSFQWYQYDGRWDYEPVTRRERVASGDLDLNPESPARIQMPVDWGGYELAVSAPGNAPGSGARPASGADRRPAAAEGAGSSAGASSGAMAAASAMPTPASLTFEAGWYRAPKAIDTPDLLKLSLDKSGYRVGDRARAHLEARFPGTALVLTLGDRLLSLRQVQVPAAGTSVELPVTAEWGAGVYVTALLFRPMDRVARRMPGRAIGLAWAGVEPGERQLAVEVKPRGPVAPRQPLNLEVSVPHLPPGEDAYVTLAAVDVGILNLTGFVPPAPDNWYFGQRRLGMEIRDLYGQLIDPMQGAPGVVRTGGDAGLMQLEGPPPTEDLLAFHSGILKLDAQGKAHVSFAPTDFNGTIKLMALAWSSGGIGHGATDLIMRDPIVIQPSLPRFLAPGDQSRVWLELTHVEGPAGRVEVNLELDQGQTDAGVAAADAQIAAGGPLAANAGGPAAGLDPQAGQDGAQAGQAAGQGHPRMLNSSDASPLKPAGQAEGESESHPTPGTGQIPGKVAPVPPTLEIDESARHQTLELAAGGRARIEVPVRAIRGGDASLRIRLDTAAGRQIVKRLRLPIRDNRPPLRQTRVETLKPGGSGLVLGSEVFNEFQDGSGSLLVSASGAGRLDLAGLVNSLDRYPYGCAEQIVSRALPLLYLNQVALAAGLRGENQAATRIKAAITDLIGKQRADGGFGLWAPGGSADPWLDAYVTDFLTRAREAGYAVPQVALELALDSLRNRLAYAADIGSDNPAPGDGDADDSGQEVKQSGGEDIAYALYVLARNARAVIGDLRYYAEAKLDAFATPMARAQLGAALALYGDKARADRAFASAFALLDRGEAGDGWRPDFGTGLRDAAALLALAAESGSSAVERSALAQRLDALGALDNRLSTQEQAWLLMAAHSLMQGAARPRLALNGQRSEGPVFQRLTPEDFVNGPLTLVNLGKDPVEVLVTVTGIPKQAPPAGGQGLAIERAFYDQNGRRIKPDHLEQGQRLVVILTVTADQPGAARLLIDDPLPAGLEIENPSLLRASDLLGIPWLGLLETSAHQEFRADRFIAAIDRQANDPPQFQLAYRVRAVSPGRFHYPFARVEDMYRPKKLGWSHQEVMEIRPNHADLTDQSATSR